MEKEITIYDIAESLNISPSTVSRALNDHPAINSKTKASIQAEAQKLGYRSNKFARNLRTKSTNIIGVIVPRLDSVFMSTVIAGIERIVSEAGYNLLITQSQESEKNEIYNARLLFNSRVDGLLVSVSSETKNTAHYDAFFRKNIPVLFFDRVLPVDNIPKLTIDNVQAGYKITRHLIDQGCKNIMHITGDLNCQVYKERFEGFQKALTESNVAFQEELLLENSISPDEVVNTVEFIIQLDKKPDGIFVSNDNFAVNLLVSLKAKGIKIPQDIAIAGFNNDPVCQVVEPKLTTIHYPGEELGEMAAKSLISHLSGQMEISLTQSIVLAHKLMERGSSIRKG